MDMMDKLLVIRVNNLKKKKKTVILIFRKVFLQAYYFKFFTSQNSFFVKQIVLISSLIKTSFLSDFWLGILNLKYEKHLKKVSE